MKRFGTLLCALLWAAPCTHAWLGVKRPRVAAPRPDTARAAAPVPAPSAPAAAAKAADTVRLDRIVRTIPAGSPGRYLGTLEGVRCFNCAPDLVLLNLGDSVTTEAAVLALHIDVWNAIERPLKDRRLYDYGNRCFYFGYREKDTAFVGGEWTEIRVQELPCYPYVQRTLAPRPSAPGPARALAAVPDPVPATAPSDAHAPAPAALAASPVPAADPVIPAAAPTVGTAPAALPAKASAKAAAPTPSPAPPAPAPIRRPPPAAVPMDVVLEPADD
jgi:hypothetical protein